MNKKGFTLVELLVAMTVFGLVGSMSSVVFMNIVKYDKRNILERTIYADAEYVMNRIKRELDR